MTARLVDWQRRTRRSRSALHSVPTIDTSVTLSAVWCTLQGTLAFVIGFACLPEDAACTVELRLRADEALSAAKGAGKGVGRRYGRLAAAAPAMHSLGRAGIARM
ncbi:hypothetical protein ABVV53_11710 [Novosphingobium sp. RD2P27]|uniref:Uncharacterized protein n=1 Tax=Novosphingobium kalidii TaxID=3230299 RepID=A0ABV2D2M1_9SPHN